MVSIWFTIQRYNIDLLQINDSKYMKPVRSWTPKYPSRPGCLITWAMGWANVAGRTKMSQKMDRAGWSARDSVVVSIRLT
jgi:hypothetical protein